MLTYLIYFQKLMKRDTQNVMKLVSANADWMQVFVIINKDGMKINADVGYGLLSNILALLSKNHFQSKTYSFVHKKLQKNIQNR